MRISLNFTCKYRLSFAPHYVFTESPKMIVNLRSGRVIKQIMKGGSIGCVIDGKFYTLTRLRECLEKIKNEEIPF
jgi:hypothetical protein